MKNWKIILAILTANVVFMSASYTMLIPFLPMYLVRELGVSQSEVTMWSGVVFSVTFLIGGIMAPLWGKMADTHAKSRWRYAAAWGLRYHTCWAVWLQARNKWLACAFCRALLPGCGRCALPLPLLQYLSVN